MTTAGEFPSATLRGDSACSSASTSFSAASVWSDAASQSSDDSSSSTYSSDLDPSDSYFVKRRQSDNSLTKICCIPAPQKQQTHPPLQHQQQQHHHQQQQQQNAIVVPAELRQNPRRTTGPGRVASLVRQSDRRVNFVDSLVDSSTQIVETIWPYGSKNGLSLRTFIQETLRRSRTSYSTLQVALYYLILIKPHVPRYGLTPEQLHSCFADNLALLDGRRMFLSALILASKYLQDRNYSSRAWSKITGLTTQEINQNEMSFLISINWKLHITNEVFRRWTEIVLKHTPPPSPPSPGIAPMVMAQPSSDWRRIILELRPDLSNIEALIPTPAMVPTPAPSPTSSPAPYTPSDLYASSPRSILNYPIHQGALCKRPSLELKLSGSLAVPPTPPAHDSSKFSGRLAPVLSAFPTPSVTPRNPPARSSGPFMGLAKPQATTFLEPLDLDRISDLPTCSRVSAVRCRPQFCNSFSNATLPSPESMILDSSRSSRSSSISSASSLASATLNTGLLNLSEGPSQCSDDTGKGLGQKFPTTQRFADCGITSFTSSPEQYASKNEYLPLKRSATHEQRLENMVRYSESDAAQALQELHDFPRLSGAGDAITPAPRRSGLKRERGLSIEGPRAASGGELLQDPAAASWSECPVRHSRKADGITLYAPVPVHALQATSKRICLSG
ncbi:G1/S-specific cyclin pas1 [Escovopsis weberi]|uniref:G1/S-specific cyclin pas1 n=1 Tax=Escovopsis weberi TaxID=150374 RepID=A0A0M8N184_ESCWE|nr:G1/S-specific cyclin pas1 [Escovopsis weberi]